MQQGQTWAGVQAPATKRPGWRSSEFWVALLALAVPFLDVAADGVARGAQPPADVTDGGAWARSLGAGVVAAGYAFARAWVKAKASQPPAPPAPTVLLTPAAGVPVIAAPTTPDGWRAALEGLRHAAERNTAASGGGVSVAPGPHLPPPGFEPTGR